MATFIRTDLDRTAQAVAYVDYMTEVTNSLYMVFYEADSAGADLQDLGANPETLTIADIENPKFYIKIDKSATSNGMIKLVKPDPINGSISYFSTLYAIVNKADAFNEGVNLVYIRISIPPAYISYTGDIRGYGLVLNPSIVGPPVALATADKYVNTEIDPSTGQLLYTNNITKYTRSATGGEFIELILPF